MPRRDSIQNQATSDDPSAAATAWLPQDVLTCVFLRLPASDLRRFRRVCKEWREVISDPAFIDKHMDHGPRALTHTIVFFVGRAQPIETDIFFNNIQDGHTKLPRDGEGYLLDEHWRVAARFTVSDSEDMVGACNGLLCFLDVVDDAINIVEPFTGESITLPLPLETETWHTHITYCLGFDPSLRRYKLLHLSKSSEQGPYMYTIGEDTMEERAALGNSYSSPKIIGGAAYWSVTGNDSPRKLMRLDLATEEVTSELIKFRQPNDPSPVFCVMGVLNAGVCLMTTGQQDEVFIGVGARWANSNTVRIPPWRPQALQRGHLLLADYGNGALYAHPIAPRAIILAQGTWCFRWP